MVFVFRKHDERYLYHRIVYLIKEMQADKQKSKKEKDVLAGWINKQLNSKNKADKKEWKNQKRNLIPKPEKLTAKERGIVQWIARFESGYRRKRIGTRFLCLGIKVKILFLCCFQAAKKRKNLLTNSWKGGIIVNVAENNTDTTKTIQKQ